MSDPQLACPFAEYRAGMIIYCKRTGEPCAHAFYKRCKGWWALSPVWAACPLLKEEPHGQK